MTDKEKNLYYLEELSDYKVASDDPDVRGWKVKDADDRVVGKVDNLLVSKRKEKVVYLDVEVDQSILDADHKPYRKSASDDVHEFINKDGENHIILPVGLARLNEDDKYVYTDKINHQTFAETKRKKRGADVDREYETVVLESYERGRTTADTSARPRTETTTATGTDTATAGTGAAASGRETPTSGAGTGTAGTGRDISGTGKTGTGRDTGTPTTGTAGTRPDASTNESPRTGRETEKSTSGTTGTGREAGTSSTETRREGSTTGTTGTSRDASTTGTTGTGRDTAGTTGTGRDGTTGTDRDTRGTGTDKSSGTPKSSGTGNDQTGARRTGGAGTGPDAQGVRNEQTSMPGDRDVADRPQNRNTDVTADNNATVGRRSTDTAEEDSFYDREEFDRSNYRQKR